MLKAVILIGNGCRGNRALVERLCCLGTPVLTTWQAIDLVPEDCPTFCGRPGVIGQRAANIIQQKADGLFVYGSRLDMEQMGWNPANFAPRARKFIFDVDEAELDKLPKEWTRTQRDLSRCSEEFPIPEAPAWLKWCRDLYARFRPELEGRTEGEPVDPYTFVRVLSEALAAGAILVPGSSGMQSCALMQAFKVKRGQRILLCNTSGAMGMEPMAIGAAVASGEPVVVVTGNGMALNMQELEIVDRLKLPIQYFIFSNGGYGSVASMQDARFGLRVGADRDSGMSVTEPRQMAAGFGLPFHAIRSNSECETIPELLAQSGPWICEVRSSLDFKYACKMGSMLVGDRFLLDPMEDMTPKIPDLADLMAWGEE